MPFSKASTTISTIVNLRAFSTLRQDQGICLSFRILSFSLWSAEMEKSTRRQGFF